METEWSDPGSQGQVSSYLKLPSRYNVGPALLISCGKGDFRGCVFCAKVVLIPTQDRG